MSDRSVRVRMYHVGFGDCLLLRFPAAERDRLVLVDCGVHSASRGGKPLATVVNDVVEQARQDGNTARIDVVVATHRHRDHVHGFREQAWEEVEVGEVWMPWTEDPDDPEARRVKDRQSKRASLLLALAATDAQERWAAVKALAENNDAYSNALAMATLHAGFAGIAGIAGSPQRFYLPDKPDGPRSRTFTTPLLPGVGIDVLGPSRSERAIRDMEPPAGESYLRIDDGRGVARTGRPLPFEDQLLTEQEFQARYKHFSIKAGDLGAIVNAGRDDALALAVALEQAVNGTSLMLVFRYGNLKMLFAGDSQWGTWDHVLGDPANADLLSGLALYKVGHHGSHNATPKDFVDGFVRRGSIALVPVGPTSIPTWSEIPRRQLLAALSEHGAYVIRSDRFRQEQADAAGREAAGIQAEVSFSPDGLWSEVALPLD
jgi:beta-lactamase superfamily II metal-dependent hydrolase